IRYFHVTGVQTCALPIFHRKRRARAMRTSLRWEEEEWTVAHARCRTASPQAGKGADEGGRGEVVGGRSPPCCSRALTAQGSTAKIGRASRRKECRSRDRN